MKRSVISSGDALRAVAALRPRDEETLRAVIRMLGLTLDAGLATRAAPSIGAWKPSAPKSISTAPIQAPAREREQAVLPANQPAVASRLRHVRSSSAAPAPPGWLDEPGEVLGTLPAGDAPRKRALFDRVSRRGLLSAALATLVPEGDLDVDAIVDVVGRGRGLKRLPRLPAPTLRGGAQLLLDVSAGMDPFLEDQQQIINALDDILADDRLDVLYFAGCPDRGVGRGPRDGWTPWTPPPHGVAVVVLTDLGIGGPVLDDERAAPAEWLRFAQRVQAEGHALVALVPYEAARWPAALSREMVLIHWSERTTVGAVRRTNPPRLAAATMTVSVEKAAERIERYRRRDSDAVRLARLTSLAVRIQPHLLRRLRLEFLPEVDVGTEADVWFGPLVESRGADAIVLDPHAADVLREDLAAEPELLGQVRKVTDEAHRNAPPTIRLEEELNGLALLNEGDAVAAINEALRPAIRAVYEGGDRAMEIAHWVRRALPRLHRRVRRTQGAMSLLLASDSLLGSRPLSKTPDADVSADTLAWILSAAALSTRFRLGVELVERGLRFVAPAPDSPAIELPRTDPALLELEWTRDGLRVKKLVDAEAGRTVDLEGEASEVVVRTVAGDEYVIERAEAEDITEPPAPAASPQRPLGLDHDVFISYAHLDDAALEEGQRGWVSDLHRALSVRLAQLLGKEVRIWRDPKPQGNDVLADTLIDRLLRSAVFVAVMSPLYVNSEWCQRELEGFLRASVSTGGVQIGDKSRLFKVLKAPVPLDQHPRALRGLLGYEFFKIDPESGRVRELGSGSSADLQRAYWLKLDDLAHDIANMVTSRPEEAASSPGASAVPHRAIYLAETSADVREYRVSIKKELLQHGYTVLPDRPLPLAEPEYSESVRAHLAQCQLSIHMVGENYGLVPDNSTESFVVLQHELALERGAAADFGRVIWLRPELKIDDDRQRKFVARLETDSHLLIGPLQDFKMSLLNLLERREFAQSVEQSGPRSVYLICERRDVDDVRSLADFLWSRCEVISTLFEGDEQDLREYHEENLRTCDAAVIYYGAASDLWVRRKVRELQKSAGYGRTKPWLAKAVYVAPPATPEKARLRTHDAVVIRAGENVTEEALHPFLELLDR